MKLDGNNLKLGELRSPFVPQQDWRSRWLKKALNTFSPKFSYRSILNRSSTSENSQVVPAESRWPGSRVVRSVAFRLKRWLPTVDEGLQWRYATGARRGPELYVDMTSDVEYVAHEVFARSSSYAAPVLDLGCSCGRALNRLRELGLTNLFGVDASPDALVLGGRVFPELYATASIEADLMQSYLLKMPEGKFETLFSNGATIELVHPSFPLLRHMARVTRDYIVLNISENFQTYPRLWEYELSRYGFILVKLLRPISQGIPADATGRFDSMSLLVFQRVKQS